jgi:hypothetical protein
MTGFGLSTSGFRIRVLPMRAAVKTLVLGLALFVAACGKDNTTTTPTTPTTPTGPTTSTFASRLTPGGAVSRAFTTSAAGTVTAMLTNAAGPSNRVGLGIGVPSTGLARCALTTAISTAPGSTPQLSVAVDEGLYCIVVYDLGTLTTTIDFSVTLVYP